MYPHVFLFLLLFHLLFLHTSVFSSRVSPSGQNTCTVLNPASFRTSFKSASRQCRQSYLDACILDLDMKGRDCVSTGIIRASNVQYTHALCSIFNRSTSLSLSLSLSLSHTHTHTNHHHPPPSPPSTSNISKRTLNASSNWHSHNKAKDVLKCIV